MIPYFTPKWSLTTLAAVGAAVVVFVQLRRTMKRRLFVKKLNEKIAMKRQQRQDSIEAVKKQFEATELYVRSKIRSLSFTLLAKSIKTQKYTCVQVLHAFQEQAVLAYETTNCVTSFIIGAEAEAAQRDTLLNSMTEEDRQKLSALFGMPTSVKESVAVENQDSTIGLAQFIGQPMEKDCSYVNSLRKAGAVPFVLTNLPQTCLSYASSNPIFGETTHPLNAELSPGGSSSGEAALIAMEGSPFGTGTDVGGSIRMPAAMTGIYGFRPTMLRLSMKGVRGTTPGRQMIGSSAGPMVRDVDAIEAVLQAVLRFDYSKVDMYAPPIGWHPVEPRKLRIGYYVDDDYFTPIPAIQRAVNEAADALREMGHELLKFTPPDVEKVPELAMGLIRCDDTKFINDLLDHDIREPNHENATLMVDIGQGLCRYMKLKSLSSEEWAFRENSPQSSSDLRKLFQKSIEYRSKFQQKWIENDLDVLLTPACGTVALPNELISSVTGAYMYTLLFNLLDYCGGVLPWTKVTEEDVFNCQKAIYPKSSDYHRIVYEANSCMSTVGLPVGVQITAPPYREELCVMAMKELAEAIKK